MSSVVSTRDTFFDEILSPDSAKSLAGKNCRLEVWQHIESSGHLKSGTDWNPSCWNTSCEHVNPVAGLFSFLSGNLFIGERMVLKILEIKFRILSPFSLKTCHILAQLHYVLPCLGLVCAHSLPLCLAPCDPMAQQASLYMGFSRQDLLEWVVIPSSRGSSQPRDQTHVSHNVSALAGRFFTTSSTWEAPFGPHNSWNGWWHPCSLDEEISWGRNQAVIIQLSSCVTLDTLLNFSGLHFPSCSVRCGN